MKEFIEKYVLELVIALTLAIVFGVKQLINYFIKTKFVDRMDMFDSSLKNFECVVKNFAATAKDLENNVDGVITKVGEFMLSMEEFKERLEKSREEDQKHTKETLDSFLDRLKKVEEKQDINNEKLSNLTTTHNLVHKKFKIDKDEN